MAFVLTRRSVGGTGGSVIGDSGLEISIINGQPIVTYPDTSRGSPGKQVSVAEQVLIFSENRITSNEWLEIGNAIDTDSGYIADLDGAVMYATGHCEDTNTNSADIHLFINGSDEGSIGTLSGGANATFINTALDVDFIQSDKIRLQAQNVTGPIQDTVIKLTLKWRA